MKKSILVLTALLLMAMLFGCGKTEQPEETGAKIAETPAAVQTEEIETSVPAEETIAETVPPVEVDFPKLEAGEAVPEGCVYKTAEGTILASGEAMPAEVLEGDTFTTKEFTYTARTNMSADGSVQELGWNAAMNGDPTAAAEITQIEEILYEQINGLPINTLMGTFKLCTKLEVSPAIPDTVTNMTGAFMKCTALRSVTNLPKNLQILNGAFVGCTTLTEVPALPENLFEMASAFQQCESLERTPDFSGCTQLRLMDNGFNGCISLKKVSDIPENVVFMNHCFNGCAALQGTISIHAKDLLPNNCQNTFAGCSGITITGSCPAETLDALAESGTDIHLS